MKYWKICVANWLWTNWNWACGLKNVKVEENLCKKQKNKQIEEFRFSESYIFSISIFCWFLGEFHGHFMVFLRLFCALFAIGIYLRTSFSILCPWKSIKLQQWFCNKILNSFENLNQNISGLLDKVWCGQQPKNQRKERKNT